MREAGETRRPVVRENLAVEIDDRVQIVNLTVKPFGEQGGTPLFLVVFADVGPLLSPDQAAAHGRTLLGERRRGGRASRASCAPPASVCKRWSRTTSR